MIIKLLNEVRDKNTLVAKDDILSEVSVSWGLMELPVINLTFPITYAKYLSGKTQIEIETSGWVYLGFVESKDLDFKSGTVSIETYHVANKLSKRTMPTNVTLKNSSIKTVIEHTFEAWKREDRQYDFVNDFKIEYVDSYAELYLIEYEFSNETLLEFLTKVCEKSPDLYWRVNRFKPYQIDVGTFGRNTNVFINEHNNLIDIENVEEDYSEVVNVSVVMSDKSDSGASSLTMRDIFYNPELQVEGFPVIKTGNKVNSQRHYQYPQIPQFAPEIIGEEFAVMDEKGVSLEAGEFYWGTIIENDTQAIADDNQPINNDDRIKATQQLYQMAMRRLINSRRKLIFKLSIVPITDKKVQVGDKVMFSLQGGVWQLTNCTRYYEKVLKTNDWFYVTQLTDSYSEGGHNQKIELSKFIYSKRDTTVTT